MGAVMASVSHPCLSPEKQEVVVTVTAAIVLVQATSLRLFDLAENKVQFLNANEDPELSGRLRNRRGPISL